MGRFRLLERIGSGGMGTVYRAFDERLQRQVAVKEVDAEPDRVIREAQAAARLNHPAVVTLYELGERAGRAVLVSELVPGATLAELRRYGTLSDRDVAEIGIDVCAALDHAHARGVVHRDIKPQNVIVRDDEAGGRLAKLMDFGIARLAGAPTLTAAGEVVGTLAYMSPEQAEGAPAGPPSDVYSLALSLYECWSGANPVAGDTPAQTARRIGARIKPLRELRPDLPEGLCDTIDAGLEPEAELRPAPAELGECLEAEIEVLDAYAPLPGTQAAEAEARRTRLGAVRLVVLAGIATALGLLAGPFGQAGLAVTLAALLAPAAILGLSAASLTPLAAPLLAQVGLGGAAAALGSAAASIRARALLGVASWAWLLCASLALGAGPELGIAERAPEGWASDVSTAASDVLAPLGDPSSLAGAAIFALAAVALGWVLRLRHGSVALLAAMLWAAGVDAALTLVGNGALGGHAAGVVGAAVAAVALEFGLLRPQAGDGHEQARRRPLRRRLASRLA